MQDARRLTRRVETARSHGRLARHAPAVLVAAVVLGDAAVITWPWVRGGNVTDRSTGDLLTSIGRLTGLLGAYLALSSFRAGA